jgi:hypothetical protein
MEDMAKGLPGYVKEYDDAKVEVQKTADAARKAKEAAEKAAAEQAAAYHKVVADDLIERKEAEAAALLKEAEELKAKPALEVLGIVKPDAVDSEDVKPETADGNAESETANNGEDVKPDAVDSESVAPETADVATAKKTRGRKAAK